MKREEDFSVENVSKISPEEMVKRNKKIGLLWIIGPIIGLTLVLVLYSVTSFMAASMVDAGLDMQIQILSIVRSLLGLFGLIATIGIIVGIPIAISYLSKKIDGIKYDKRSGMKSKSIVPEEIKGWSWGAAGLTWIWGVYHGVWISLLMFVPIINMLVWIILGIKGNEWAWKARQWESVEKFIASQRKWKYWGIALITINILFTLLSILSIKA